MDPIEVNYSCLARDKTFGSFKSELISQATQHTDAVK